ncbi:ABC transporter permease [Acidobacteriota bacterium]
MFQNYLRIALRNVQKHKGYAFINIAGLAIGMACCILIVAYILTELSYDRFHENAERIYRVAVDGNVGGKEIKVAFSNAPLAPVLKQDYPEVLSAARLWLAPKRLVKYKANQFYEEGIMFADPSIFNVFTFPMIKGDPTSALVTAYTGVLTEETAKKYFGNDDPIGKVLDIDSQYKLTVTGVVENVPQNSHFTFDMLISFETLYDLDRESMEMWFNFNLYTYLLLPENYDYRDFDPKLAAVAEKHLGKNLRAIGVEINYFLQPLTDIHLFSRLEGEVSGNGDILYVYIFAGIALFILFIACINFMNLATARSATRAKEVGLRKVVGAARKELIRQFLGESIVYSMFSLISALVLVQISLPLFSSISGVKLEMNYVEIPWLIPALVGLVLFVGVVAGSYPALFLSAFQPATVLKSTYRTGAGNSRFRSILVTLQFVISVALIIGTIIVINQLNFMKNKSLHFDKDNVLCVQITDDNIQRSLDFVKDEIKKIPGVISVAASSDVPGENADVQPFLPEGYPQDQTLLMEQMDIDDLFLNTLGIGLVEGRNFSREFQSDQDQAVIINETAVRVFGWKNPIGKTIRAISDRQGQWETKRVIGVVKNFHMVSLQKIIMPLFISNDLRYLNDLSIKISPINTARTMELLKEKWKDIDPNRPFEYTFLDETFDQSYKNEERLRGIFASFSVFAIFIACLGLFGMASFTAEQKTKEIGIRKVLGASIPGIVILFAKNFLKLVIVANLIAWPIAYFAMNNWLTNFAYRTKINPWVFVFCGALTLSIALLTVSYQSIRASISNPVKAIKHE